MDDGRGILGIEAAWHGRLLMVACPNIGEFKRLPCAQLIWLLKVQKRKGWGHYFLLFFINI